MEKIYNPHSIELSIYRNWEKQGYFKPNFNNDRDSFCIMIPPPNITGNLHIGHAFQQTLMDIIIRYQRMQGKNTLWQAGTDHAGIATQMLVEQQIASEYGNDILQNLSREKFIKKVWEWKLKSSNNIKYQIKRLGNSLDWENERFTMDKGISNAVVEAFVSLYKENLIYKSKRLVNWDTKLRTAISDLEVENREFQGKMWYIRYPLANNIRTLDNKNYVVVATTRPETILGDTGVAVNPENPYYNQLIGKYIILPLVNRCIPIIGDSYASLNKGSGCVKITPAHDFNDYKVGYRHKLAMINILNTKGNIREHAEVFNFKGEKSSYFSNKIPIKFQNLDRFLARQAIISAIDNLGLLEKEEVHNIVAPYSIRTNVLIEPMLTDQWYLCARKLAPQAIEVVKKGYIKFIPKQYENMYFSWMQDIQDWCISRQLWWGHRIPAWYDNKDNIYVGRNEEEIRKENDLSSDIFLHQDEDVLDTWFSSSLWTFSALGWPEKTELLSKFHPTDVIVSGFDIIFFWIARMIMMTVHLLKDKNGDPQIPFRIVYITGLIRDNDGQKMSKSKGNVIDPIDIIDGISLSELLKKRTDNMIKPNLANQIYNITKKQFPNGIKSYGTDALRFTLAASASTSRYINWDFKRLEGYRNFCNKLWNASRFILKNTIDYNYEVLYDEKYFSILDKWIFTKLNFTIKKYRTALDNFRFDVATTILYEFIWNQFCNWYLELSKKIINYNDSSLIELKNTRYTMITVLETILRIAHPIIPFITENIWQYIKNIMDINNDTIMLQKFPKNNEFLIDKNAYLNIEFLKKLIVAVRSIRVEMNLSHNKLINLLIRSNDNNIISYVLKNERFLKRIAYINEINILSENDICPISITRIVDGVDLFIPIMDIIDKSVELNRLLKEINKVELKINIINNKLSNKGFSSYAPKEIIFKEREKLNFLIELKNKLIKQQKIIEKI